MAAELLKYNCEEIKGKLGRDLRTREFYLTHFLGRQGANRLLEVVNESPQIRASAIFPEAAAANRAIFYDKPTVKTVLRTVVKKRRKKVTYKKVRVRVTVHNHRSVEKVYTNLGDMILKRMARFGI
jgi:hypothetical protein